jgi:hypothetical protein
MATPKTDMLQRALRHRRFLRRIEERVEAALAGDEAALAQLKRHIEPRLPELTKVVRGFDMFELSLKSEIDRLLRMTPRVNRTPDIDKMADAMFTGSLLRSVESTLIEAPSRLRSSEGGTKGGRTNATTADANWRREATWWAQKLSSKRRYSQRELAKQVWSHLPDRKRPSESAVRALIGKLAREGKISCPRMGVR